MMPALLAAAQIAASAPAASSPAAGAPAPSAPVADVAVPDTLAGAPPPGPQAGGPILATGAPALIPLSRPELWRGARVGMTLGEVQALFPYGRLPLATVSRIPPVPNAVSGGAAGWAVDEQVFGRPAVATYYFAGPLLLEVVVNVKGLRLRHTYDNVEAARSIEAGMRRYYGEPQVCLDTSRRGLDRLDCRWRARQVQVGLSYVDYGGLGPNLDVAVRAEKPRVRETGEVFSRHSIY